MSECCCLQAKIGGVYEGDVAGVREHATSESFLIGLRNDAVACPFIHAFLRPSAQLHSLLSIICLIRRYAVVVSTHENSVPP